MVNKNDYGLYFLNDLYDDEIIRNSSASFKSRLYNENLKNEKYSQNIQVKNGSLIDIDINRELNQKYDLPINSYSLHFNCNIIPYFSEKVFAEKYGYGSIITSVDIMNDKDVFDKYLYFFIGDYLIYDVKIVIEKQECIVFIPVETFDTASNMNLKHIESILTGPTDYSWTLMLTKKTDFYYTYLSRSVLITDNKIYLSKFNTKRLVSKSATENCWTLYLTHNNMSKNVMIATDSTLMSDVNGYYFTIPEAFKSIIVSENTHTIKCLVVNEPECSGKGIYIRSSESIPRFQIPFKKNPIPAENFVTWKYDSKTSRKLHPIVQSVELSYPNIYDFSEMMTDGYIMTLFKDARLLLVTEHKNPAVYSEGSELYENTYDLHISWMESTTHCINEYESYIDDYITFYGDKYPTMKLNESLHPLIRSYSPISQTPGSFNEYMKSEYYGDYRAWSLQCLIDLLNDNPRRYDELYHKLYSKNKKFITKTYTYESTPFIYERAIRNNSDHCDNVNERVMYFTKDHTYIEVFNKSCKDRPCVLYINGIRRHTTYVMTFGCNMYIYFPCSLISNHEDIQVDIEIDIDDIYTNVMTIDSMFSKFDLDNILFHKLFSLSNLCFYNQETGDIIDIDAFLLQLKMLKSNINYCGGEIPDEMESVNDTIFAQMGIDYRTSENYVKYLDLDENEVESHKKINLNNLIVELMDTSLVGTPIAITNTNFFRNWTINEILDETRLYDSTIRKVLTSKNEYILLVRNKETDTDAIFYMNNFKGTQSSLWFRVYHEGRLVNPKRCLFLFDEVYNSEVQLFIEDLIDDGEVVIDYLGHDEEIIYNDIIGPLKTIGDDIIYLDNIISTPFSINAYRLFIDGYRIPEYCISTIGESTMLILNNLKFEVNDESNLIIYRQIYDSDPYDYSTEKGFLASVCKDDKGFRRYMIDKYKK